MPGAIKLHETLVSAGLAWGIGHSGAQGAGANAPDVDGSS
jgi:hypothetical protein